MSIVSIHLKTLFVYATESEHSFILHSFSICRDLFPLSIPCKFKNTIISSDAKFVHAITARRANNDYRYKQFSVQITNNGPNPNKINKIKHTRTQRAQAISENSNGSRAAANNNSSKNNETINARPDPIIIRF